MELVTAEEMRAIDRRATEAFGLPVELLMEQAGYQVARVAAALFGGADPAVGGAGPVAVVAGPGNNGGDGLVAARYLHQWGVPVQVHLAAQPSALRGSSAANLERLTRLGVPVRPVPDGSSAGWAAAGLETASLILDAVLGTGARAPLSPALAAAIEAIGGAGRPVLAVDVPSGLDADTGRPLGARVRADVTVTLCRPKLGMVLEAGAEACGAVAVAPIPIPEEAVRAQGVRARLLTAEEAARFLPPRPWSGHKGTFGHVLVVAGATGYAGAAALAALGALRGGAGLVTLACPQRVAAALAGRFPEVIVRPFPGEDAFVAEAAEGVAGLAAGADVVCVGPGLGRRPETGSFLRLLLGRVDKPLVLDADGLNLLDLAFVSRYAGPAVLTPHPGEMARLLGGSPEAVQADRPGAARAAAARAVGTGAGAARACVLKGARSLVADADGRLWVNPTGSDALATAGTGDVLAGVVAALLAQGAGPVPAAAAAVHVHGLAGELAAARRGTTRSVTAGDVVECLGQAFRRAGEAGVQPGGVGRAGHNGAGGLIWLPGGQPAGSGRRAGRPRCR